MSRLKCVGENDYDDDDDDDFYYDDDERHPTPLQEEHVLRKI